MKIVFVDIETTGLNPETSSVIEIGAVKTAGKEAEETFYSLARPAEPLREEIKALTGFTDEHFVSAPDIKGTLEKFFAFIAGCKVASYGMDFIKKFLERKAEECGIAIPAFEETDILALARKKIPGLASYKKQNIMALVGLENSSRNDCLSIALAEKELYFRLNELQPQG